MSERPYEAWGRTEWTVVGTLAVVVVIYVVASVAALADVSGAGRVADAASGGLWLTMSAWLLFVYSGFTGRWQLVGAAGFAVAGVTELVLLFVASGLVAALNFLGLLVAAGVLLADLLGLL